MSGVRYRRRGTAIVDTQCGILLTAGRRVKSYILPSGGAKRAESRFVAALRELTEETGLLPYAAEIVFRHEGKVKTTRSGRHRFRDQHTVCLVKATGTPRPGGGDAQRIAYCYPGCNVRISRTTKEIIERYHEWKTRQTGEQTVVLDEDDGETDDAEGGRQIDYDDDE